MTSPPTEGQAVTDLSSDARVLVTGANGFVGGRVCRRLTAAGTDVVALVRRADADLGDAGDVAVAVAALDDPDGLADALSGVTHVVHCAATAGDDLDVAAAVNVTGTRSLIEAAADEGVERFVHISTTSVVHEDATVVDETADLVGDDANPYSVTKRDGETVVHEVAAARGIDLVVLRPPAVLGWSPTSTWGQKVPARVASGELPFAPDRRAPMGWVHVDDLAEAVVLGLVDGRAVGELYTVVGGTTTWGEFLDEIVSWFPGCPDPFSQAEVPPAPRSWSAKKLRDELGWTPTRSFDAAMTEASQHHG